MKKVWLVEFEEQGGEYTGYLTISANRVKQLDNISILADEVQIGLDEKIISIKEIVEIE